MKKILLASSALVLTAGYAAADVTVSGDGRMGILYDETGFENAINDDDSDYSFTSRIRIKFTASGETDGGLVFGGSVRLDQEDELGERGSNGTAGNVFISGGFGKLSMGDPDGAAEVVVGDLAGVGLTGLGDVNEFLYLFGANDPSALYEYTTGGMTLAFSVSDDEEYALGLAYDGGMWSVGIGYESVPDGSTIQVTIDDQDFDIGTANGDLEQVIAGASVTFSDVTLKGIYGTVDGDNAQLDQYGLSASGSFGATTVSAYWRTIEVDPDDGDSDQFDAYGLGAEYDLGGGASVVAGVADIDDNTVADFGLSFEF